MKIAICDDDEKCVEIIKTEVIRSLNGNDYEVHGFENGNSFVKYCKFYKPDIVIVDIDMPDRNGFQLAREIREYNDQIRVIFVTSHMEYAYKAYDYAPYCFVSKSDMRRLTRAMKELEAKFERKQSEKMALSIKAKNNVEVKIDVRDVIYFDTSKNYVKAHTLSDESSQLFRGTIKSVYAQIKDHHFIMIHKGFIANCRYIKRITRTYVLLKNDQKVEMTRNRDAVEEAMDIYADYIREVL